MARGRQKGQTKRVCKIKDTAIAPYEVWVDEDQFTLLNTDNDKIIDDEPQYTGKQLYNIKKNIYIKSLTI